MKKEEYWHEKDGGQIGKGKGVSGGPGSKIKKVDLSRGWRCEKIVKEVIGELVPGSECWKGNV